MYNVRIKLFLKWVGIGIPNVSSEWSCPMLVARSFLFGEHKKVFLRTQKGFFEDTKGFSVFNFNT